MAKHHPHDAKIPLSSLAFLSHESVAALTEALSEGVMLVDTDGIVYHVNQAAQALHMGGDIPRRGVPLANASPHDWIETKKVLTTGISQICAVLRLPQASVIVNRMPVMRGGRIAGAVTVMQDINNLNAILGECSEYRKLSQEFDIVVNQFEGAFLSLDGRGVIRNVNSAYEKLISLGRQGVIGRHIEEIQRSPRALVTLFNKAAAAQTQTTLPVPLPRGQSVQGHATPSLDSEGRLFRVLLHLKQIPLAPDAAPPRVPPAAEKAGLPSVELQRLCNASGFTVRSAPMNHVVQQALKAGKTASCVLIQGESGVGKTMLASFIHNNSGRSSQPFVAINCGAIPEHLIESELFGYEKGAFTGANAHGKMGLIETADKGTLFLDEIGELQYSLQSKLLELFEKKSFIRVGGTRRTAVDIRILAATNKNLAEEAENGRFRRDLFYRLNVIPIAIPPLRERPEDVQAMLEQLAARYNAQNNADKKLSPELRAWLLRYPFRGNVRELVNIMEWLLVMSEGNVLTLADLPTRLRQEYQLGDPEHAGDPEHTLPDSGDASFSEASAVPAEGAGDADDLSRELLQQGLSLQEAVADFERRYLQQAMQRHSSIASVSEALDVHFSTLWRKLVKYNLVQSRSVPEKDSPGE